MTLMDNIFSGENGVAYQLLKLFGVEGNLQLKDDENFDPSTNTSIKSSGKRYTVTVTPQLSYNINDIDNNNILVNDLYCYISPVDIVNDISTVNPDVLNNSRIEINDICYNIMSIKKYVSGTETAIYKLQLRERT